MNLNIISWNICALPKYLNLFGDPKNRIRNIVTKIISYDPDIICLQEVFSSDIKKYLISYFKNYNCIFSHSWYIKLCGGLFIASKYDIIYSNEYIYKNSAGEDSLSCKGILICNILINNQMISIFNTHLNADSIFSRVNTCKLIRQKQIEELVNFIKKNKSQYNILCCDANIDIYDEIYQILILNLKELNFDTNHPKLITYPSSEKHYDYCFSSNNLNYKIYTDYDLNLSDHALINCLITKMPSNQ